MEKTWTSGGLPRTSWPTTITLRAHLQLITKVINTPKTTSKAMHPSVVSIKVKIHSLTITKTFSSSIHQNIPRWKSLLTKSMPKAHFSFSKNVSMIFKAFMKIWSRLMVVLWLSEAVFLPQKELMKPLILLFRKKKNTWQSPPLNSSSRTVGYFTGY